MFNGGNGLRLGSRISHIFPPFLKFESLREPIDGALDPASVLKSRLGGGHKER